MKSFFKEKPIRDPKFLAKVRKMTCLVQQDGKHCNGRPVEAHHLTSVGCGVMGGKAGDDKVLPLCRLHHRTLHNIGEKTFWKRWGVDAENDARELWESNQIEDK